MKSWLVKWIETFIIYIFYLIKKNDFIVIKFILGNPFHIKFLNLLHGFYDQSHV
jgi:hypothetical protein